MSDPPDEPAPNYRHLAFVGLAGSLVIAGAVAIHLLTTIDIIWSELGLHIGTGILLFAVLFFLERQYVRRQVLTHTAPALAQVASVAKQAADSLRTIDLRLADALNQQDSDVRTRATQFETAGDHASLSSLLQRAQELGAIKRYGVRTSIPHTAYYLRVCRVDDDDPISGSAPGHTSDAMRCVVERPDRTGVGELLWDRNTPADETFLRLRDIMAQDDQAPSVYEATPIRSGLVDTLVLAIKSRTNTAEGLHPVGQILQLQSDHWVVTWDGLENLMSTEKYTIEQLRRRPSRKTGEGSAPSNLDSAIEIARETWLPHDRDPYAVKQYGQIRDR